MKEQSGHITSKVILGYILLITIAVCSVAYIYNIVEKVAEETSRITGTPEGVLGH